MLKVFLEDLGKKDYKETWKYQRVLFEKIAHFKFLKKNRKVPSNYLLFVEHPNSYTLGIGGDVQHFLLSEEDLKRFGACFYKIDRGGDITFHGIGQLVVYPILDMEYFIPDIHQYLRMLEEVTVRVLYCYGLKGERSSGETGVWIDVGTSKVRKICAIGIRMSRWVSMHGFAINVNTNLKYFKYIIPCGIRNKSVTSLARELHKKIPMKDLKEKVKKSFENVFDVVIRTRE